jgi:hypothetical protein
MNFFQNEKGEHTDGTASKDLPELRERRLHISRKEEDRSQAGEWRAGNHGDEVPLQGLWPRMESSDREQVSLDRLMYRRRPLPSMRLQENQLLTQLVVLASQSEFVLPADLAFAGFW